MKKHDNLKLENVFNKHVAEIIGKNKLQRSLVLIYFISSNFRISIRQIQKF